MNFFSRSEFACKCGCGFATIDFELAKVLDDVRQHFGKRITVTSGCRCVNYNESVQFKSDRHYVAYTSKSKHLLGLASDIQIEDVNPKDVADYLEAKYPYKYGIGRYKTFTHIDVRVLKAKWGKN